MNITELVIDPTVLTIGVSGGVRAGGAHASDLYNDFMADSNPKKYGYLRRDPENKIDPLLVEPGLIFEMMLEEGLQRRLAASGIDGSVERPGELVHTDTFEGQPISFSFNPDLFIFNGIFRVGEIKATWQWSGISPECYKAYKEGDSDAACTVREVLLDPKYAKYLMQLQLYQYAVKTLFGRLYIFYVNGCGRPPFPPQLLAWDVEFSQEELDMNYACLVRHGISKGLI